ncbi:hypothetical protein VF14_21400 [Nostoc linckia z18]|jgi:hypothetical protein|uniref:Uncharacterized protein n=2 Tax=Nostoc linckia TaxID=92942 RepID=A0A9Q6EKA1_NOSLI|nr:hypothetical protein [Nostoc linckia]PHK34345.1 hypothetical protein VF12_23990 [Nostoc linckia z15]PHK44419.1 hypothetical protein VF13_22025 [Nostoc linckia z16]PHJ58640.1 hypothetical protein VF02_27120 [Nostoc linckia z1]PHJ61354.1 hypothetical protein VF05_28860 [Nostoc linckia z3]PHJ72357.1 hypothetical protein VF03_18680 [Nostoc linckia z2]
MELEKPHLKYREESEFIFHICQKLQDSLLEGWHCFKKSEDFKILSNFFDFLLTAGFDESQYRQSVPNPAYDNAAKIIGKGFLETARNLEIQFDEIFPGSFSTSQEIENADYEIRVFKLKAFYRNQPLCILLLRFPHFHEKFGFPSPPELEIIELYKIPI